MNYEDIFVQLRIVDSCNKLAVEVIVIETVNTCVRFDYYIERSQEFNIAISFCSTSVVCR